MDREEAHRSRSTYEVLSTATPVIRTPVTRLSDNRSSGYRNVYIDVPEVDVPEVATTTPAAAQETSSENNTGTEAATKVAEAEAQAEESEAQDDTNVSPEPEERAEGSGEQAGDDTNVSPEPLIFTHEFPGRDADKASLLADHIHSKTGTRPAVKANDALRIEEILEQDGRDEFWLRVAFALESEFWRVAATDSVSRIVSPRAWAAIGKQMAEAKVSGREERGDDGGEGNITSRRISLRWRRRTRWRWLLDQAAPPVGRHIY